MEKLSMADAEDVEMSEAEASDATSLNDDEEEGHIYADGGKNDRFTSEDEHILLDDPNIPSTSHQPTVTMKEMRSKKRKANFKEKRTSKRKKRKNSKRKKSKRSSAKGNSPIKKKRRHHRKHKRRLFDGQRRNDVESAHRRIADICKIDLKHSDRYKIVSRVNNCTRKSSFDASSSHCSHKGSTFLGRSKKLDLLGNEWIPPPDEEKDDFICDSREKIELNGLATTSKFTGSLSLLDEILSNQSKVLAPGNLLKVNRDGTLQETEEFHKYIEKKNKKIEERSYEKNTSSLFKSSKCVFDSLNDKEVISNMDEEISTKLEVTEEKVTADEVQENKGLPYTHVIFDENEAYNKSTKCEIDGNKSTGVSTLFGYFNATTTFFDGELCATNLKSNELNLKHVEFDNEGYKRTDKNPKNGTQLLEVNTTLRMKTDGVRCGLDSPMDIEDDNEPSSSFNVINSSKKKHTSPSSTTQAKKDRSETTKVADAAMKSALKPYFTKRMISKDEYKEIMKKGVAKLRDKNELKPEKVDKFVKQYVDLIAKKRKK